MSCLALVSTVVVGVWLALTALAQLDPTPAWLNRADRFGLLPRWTFFAPNPGVHDYHLIVRDRSDDGSVGLWRSVDVYLSRPRLAYLWHPEKRAIKVLNDTVQTLRIMGTTHSSQTLLFTLPYIMLLHVAMRGAPRGTDAAERQFAIVDSTGHVERTLVHSFLSPFHPHEQRLSA